MARRRRVALMGGLVLLALALMPPVIAVADQRLSLHMLEEMLLLAVVAPLLAYGAAPRRTGRGSWIQLLTGVLALNLALFGWQVPAVLDQARQSLVVTEVAYLLFTSGAVLFWWPILRPQPDDARLSPVAKIGYLMVAGVPPTIPGITLAFSHHLFYQGYRSIEDQQIAGLLLFGTAKFALIAGAFVILWRMLAPSGEPPDDDERPAHEPTLPPSAPAWLGRLDEPLPVEPARPRLPVPAGR